MGRKLATGEKVKVEIIESDSWSGQSIDEVKYFDTNDEAQKFCDKYNAKNNKPTVPEWYMYARIA